MTGSSWTPAVPWWEDALASNTSGHSRATWGTADCPVFLVSTSPCTHNVFPPTEPWKSSRALIPLLCSFLETSPSLGNLFLPQYPKSVRQLTMASSVNAVPNLAFYDLWQPRLTFSPCPYVWSALQPYDLGFSGLACFCYVGHGNWYHGSQEIFQSKKGNYCEIEFINTGSFAFLKKQTRFLEQSQIASAFLGRRGRQRNKAQSPDEQRSSQRVSDMALLGWSACWWQDGYEATVFKHWGK